MKKRLIATLVSLVTMIGALIGSPAGATEDAVRIEFGTLACSGGFLTAENTYVNDSAEEQSFSLTIDGTVVGGPYVLAPSTRIDTITVFKPWKPKIKSVSVLRYLRNGSAYALPDPLDFPRCDSLGIPKLKNIVPPTIVGTVAVGRTVSASTGKWNSAKLNFGYRWYVERASDGYMVPIVGAYGRTYKIKASNKGRKIMVDVVAGSGSIVEQRARSASKKVR